MKVIIIAAYITVFLLEGKVHRGVEVPHVKTPGD